MRYLRKFNESDNSLYSQIDMIDLIKQVNDKNRSSFNKIEIAEIEKALSNFIKQNNLSIVIDPYCISLRKDISFDFICQKNNDDWFFIYNGFGRYGVYYKCDQIDGLIKCLEDIL